MDERLFIRTRRADPLLRIRRTQYTIHAVDSWAFVPCNSNGNNGLWRIVSGRRLEELHEAAGLVAYNHRMRIIRIVLCSAENVSGRVIVLMRVIGLESCGGDEWMYVLGPWDVKVDGRVNNPLSAFE